MVLLLIGVLLHVGGIVATGRGAPKVALRFTSGVEGVPQLASAEAFVEFEKEVKKNCFFVITSIVFWNSTQFLFLTKNIEEAFPPFEVHCKLVSLELDKIFWG